MPQLFVRFLDRGLILSCLVCWRMIGGGFVLTLFVRIYKSVLLIRLLSFLYMNRLDKVPYPKFTVLLLQL
jgi:hypothetical protein